MQKFAQFCVLHILYADLYKSLFSNFPIEGPSTTNLSLAHILEGPQTRLLSLLQDYMWRLLSVYKTKPVINMIIKRNLKNKCIISLPAV